MPDRLPIRALLDALEPADALEGAYRAAMAALLESPGEVFDRSHFDPGHFTASAFVLAPDRRSLLLIHHQKLGRWLQPGGHFEPHDADLLAAARRELQEETGLGDLRGGALLDVDVHVIPARKGEPEHRHFDLRLHFVAGTERIVAGSDAGAARWVRLDELGEGLRDAPLATDESVMRAVRKLRGLA